MKNSAQRIRPSHVGRLPAPSGFEETAVRLARGEVGGEEVAAQVVPVVADVVKRQVEISLDGDGEYGSALDVRWFDQQMTGLGTRPLKPGEVGSMRESTRERDVFQTLYADMDRVGTIACIPGERPRPPAICVERFLLGIDAAGRWHALARDADIGVFWYCLAERVDRRLPVASRRCRIEKPAPAVHLLALTSDYRRVAIGRLSLTGEGKTLRPPSEDRQLSDHLRARLAALASSRSASSFISPSSRPRSPWPAFFSCPRRAMLQASGSLNLLRDPLVVERRRAAFFLSGGRRWHFSRRVGCGHTGTEEGGHQAARAGRDTR
jgi:hypothetical protein